MSKMINYKENLINYFQKKFTLKNNQSQIRWTRKNWPPLSDPYYFIKDSMKISYKGQYCIKFNDLLHIFFSGHKNVHTGSGSLKNWPSASGSIILNYESAAPDSKVRITDLPIRIRKKDLQIHNINIIAVNRTVYSKISNSTRIWLIEKC